MDIVKVNLLSVETYDDDFPPENLREFQSWVNDKIGMIPLSFLPNAVIEIEGYSTHDTDKVSIEIYYDRPMTKEEEATKEAAVNESRKAIQNRERKELARLKAKYES